MTVDQFDLGTIANDTAKSTALFAEFVDVRLVDKKPQINLARVVRKLVKIESECGKKFLAELLGTFIMMAFGMGSVAQSKFQSETNAMPINMAFGFGVLIAAIVTGKISGAHLNPAVSFCMLLTGRLGFKEFFLYVLGQFCGSFFAAGFTLCIYYEKFIAVKAFENFDYAGVFSTYPNEDVSVLGCLIDQIGSTALLIIFIMAIADKMNENLTQEGRAIMVAFTVMAIGFSFSHNCGYPLNPARDLPPRIFSAFIWGTETFLAGNYYFWVPIVGPMLGSLLGTLVYIIAISNE